MIGKLVPECLEQLCQFVCFNMNWVLLYRQTYLIADKENFVIRVGFENYAPQESVYITTANEKDFSLNYKITIDKNRLKMHWFPYVSGFYILLFQHLYDVLRSDIPFGIQ